MDRLQNIQTLSIIIPTLNEAISIPLLIADLKAWPFKSELILVDGGSSDSTISIAEINGLKVIKNSKPNRGHQLKTGALKAKGDWLLFLHSDSRLEKKWVSKLLKIMSKSSSLKHAWYFDFKIKNNNIQFKILEIAVALRSYFFKSPYGDQGLLIHKKLYHSYGGYSSLSIMEDLDFITRINKTTKLRRIGCILYTNDRKWKNLNVIERAIKNAHLRKKWREGYDIEKLSEEYYL